jgi:hypothetical protein
MSIAMPEASHAVAIGVRSSRTMGLRLTPAQRAVLDRLERGEITADEAERLLADDEPAPTDGRVPADADWFAEPQGTETPEEAKARQLVERIARDVYGEEEPAG